MLMLMLDNPDFIFDMYAAHAQLIIDIFEGMQKIGLEFDGAFLADAGLEFSWLGAFFFAAFLVTALRTGAFFAVFFTVVAFFTRVAVFTVVVFFTVAAFFFTTFFAGDLPGLFLVVLPEGVFLGLVFPGADLLLDFLAGGFLAMS